MSGDAAQWTWLISVKPALAAGVLALLWMIESTAPMFVGRGRRLSHGAANILLGLVNVAIATMIFGTAVLLVTEWAWQYPFGLLNWVNLPGWAGWAFGIVLFDAWMYLWHVLNHRVPLLWRFHAVHHADREMDVTTALRFHTGEIVLSGGARLVALPVLGTTTPQLLVYELVLLPVILFHHSHVHVPRRLDRLLRFLIVTPWMHWVHHSRWRPETNSNYASVLSIWDRLFGTFRLRDDPARIHLGLDDDRDERQWRTFRGMLARPFVPDRGVMNIDEPVF